jgi:hypothetical protein
MAKKRKKSQFSIKCFIITIVIVAVVIIAIQQPPKSRACTAEAKICPDGSAVGRIAPNCDFAPCPQTKIIEELCNASGGTVRTSLCCLGTGDFPDMCLIGACGCSLDNSHDVQICDCGNSKCWNGNECVTR